MVIPPITVRALATAGECEMHCHFADQAFSREPSPESARYWYQFVTTMPAYQPERLRGAFRNGEQVGSYFLHERTMHVGTARLLTGCIGAVVTYPEHRHQGVATALMQDAIDYAQSHDYPLLLLDGIPKSITATAMMTSLMCPFRTSIAPPFWHNHRVLCTCGP